MDLASKRIGFVLHKKGAICRGFSTDVELPARMAGPDQGDGTRIELGGLIAGVSQAWVGAWRV